MSEFVHAFPDPKADRLAAARVAENARVSTAASARETTVAALPSQALPADERTLQALRSRGEISVGVVGNCNVGVAPCILVPGCLSNKGGRPPKDKTTRKRENKAGAKVVSITPLVAAQGLNIVWSRSPQTEIEHCFPSPSLGTTITGHPQTTSCTSYLMC